MFTSPRRHRRWLGPSRRLLLALVAVTLAAAGSLGWLGWETLRQDADVEAQRAQERLDHQVDLAVQSLERLLAATEDRLADWVSRPSTSPPDPVDGGLVVTFTPAAVVPSPSSRLLFYPFVARRPEPAADLFAEGERAELQQHDLARAALIFRQLAGSPDSADRPDSSVRAAALMRLGRVLRKSSRPSEALAVYADMAALGDVPVIGLPAELVARSAEMQLLGDMGQRDAARDAARAVADDLAKGRWTLTQGQYEYSIDAAHAASGDVAAAMSEDLVMARATSDLWDAWKGGLPPSGHRLIRTGDARLLAAWRGSEDRVAAWIVQPEELLRRVSADAGVALALSDGDGATVAGVLDGPGRKAVRTPSDTRLPWTVHARATLEGARPSGLTRGRLIALGLATMVTFLVAGVYFIGRAVKQEMDLAQLQSDFVATVSHEFRTPLAAMRQLSELLAAGRVPHEERRQQYYESLAGESRRLQRLVENLLNFGKLQAGARPYHLEPLDPRALVEQVVAAFRSELANPGCQIQVSGDAEPVQVLADADAVGLALHNLLDNAVKYSPDTPTIDVGLHRTGDNVCISVRDRGMGIPPSERAAIFTRFRRGEQARARGIKGTGIGLAMVAEIVTAHHGRVDVDSEPGRGSTFTMVLPAGVSTS